MERKLNRILPQIFTVIDISNGFSELQIQRSTPTKKLGLQETTKCMGQLSRLLHQVHSKTHINPTSMEGPNLQRWCAAMCYRYHWKRLVISLRPKEIQIFLLNKYWSLILYSSSLVTRQESTKITLLDRKTYSFPQTGGKNTFSFPTV